ncbi:MAG TPA: hypothetical protein DDZ33_00210 [Clostridium sp.]|nr:hypothetical protein [Clostridium sp.]
MFIMDYLFEKGLDCRDVKEFVKIRKTTSLKNVVTLMSKKYMDYDENEKAIAEYRIKDIINDINGVSNLSIVSSFILAIISNLLGISIEYKIGILLVIYIVFTLYLIQVTRYYKCCKLFLSVIDDIKSGRLEIDKTNYIELKVK